MTTDDDIGLIVDALRQLTHKTTQLQGALIIERLARDTGLDAASIKIHLKDLRQQGWIKAKAWSGTGVPVGQVKVHLPPLPVPTWVQDWEDALRADGRLSGIEQASLRSCGTQLSDVDSLEFSKILDGLVRLRDDQISLTGLPVFVVSARYLLGSSKMLQGLGRRAMTAFGIDLSRFTDHPPYVITAGASDPSAVVLVENPTAFEWAVQTSATKTCAFIATFGFGLSKVSDDFGYQLAYIVENQLPETITLVREGSSTPPVRDLLGHPRITYWGDLDIAGLHIYERLASRLPTLSLSALYEPMIAAVATGNLRHPYVKVVGKAGQGRRSASRSDAIRLLTYCDTWAVDQELLARSDIERLAGKTLTL